VKILGLDLSTSCIGYCVLESADRSIIEMGHISLKNVEGLFNKVDDAVPKIVDVLSAQGISKCYVEEPVQMFTAGMSSAHTILTLAKFNALVSYHVRNVLGDENIAFVKPNEARKSCGLILTTKAKSGGKSQKEQVYEQLTSPTGLLALVAFPLTKTGKPKPENFDRADAYVVAYHGAVMSK
jgi:hypothetical protein